MQQDISEVSTRLEDTVLDTERASRQLPATQAQDKHIVDRVARRVRHIYVDMDVACIRCLRFGGLGIYIYI